MSRVEIDLTSLLAGGVTEADLAGRAADARAAVERMRGLRKDGSVGFFDLADDRDGARRCLEYARALPPAIENFVVLGIGGSSLGPRALHSALARPFESLRPRTPGLPRRLFFADNVDPVSFQAILEMCPPERTVFNAVSKSGGTVETAAQLLIVVDRLRKIVGDAALREHLVVTTDPDKGPLGALARHFKLTQFPIPASVGGRYSVLTAVGLLPAAVAGLDVQGLLDGARAMRARVADEGELMANPALLFAALLHEHDRRHHRPIHVMMPYADGLYDSAEWFRQLWAESLGKARDVNGQEVHVGPTPIGARGATDQHSQLQLFAEGPDDKVYLFVTVKERGADLALPADPLGDGGEFAYLAGHSLAELIEAERAGTTASLARAGRPTATLTLERVDAPALGGLLFFLEAATAFAGPLYGVDPFDQPGVEEGKRFAFGLIGRKGFESYADEARRLVRRDPRWVFSS